MKTKHTPGPWKITDEIPNGIRELENHIEIESSIWSIAAVFSDSGDSISTEPIANAKLIAAAPELLEALIEVLPMLLDTHDTAIKIKQAIKKATE